MRSVKIDAFLSMSFSDSDKEINDLISAICRGLDINCQNVSYASRRTPPDQAKKLIQNSQALIAICTRREELADGTFNMPQAVSDEIAFAYGIEKPILVIIEDGLNKKGFKEKLGTYLEFDKSSMKSPEFIEKIVKSVHGFKIDAIGPHQVGAYHELDDSHADEMFHLVELKKDKDDFVWEYSTRKTIIYTKDSSRSFPTSVFSTQDTKIPEGTPPIEWTFEQIGSTNNISLEYTIEQQTANCVEARLKPNPSASAGDSVTYKTFSRHKYLNELWDDECTSQKTVHLKSGDFKANEGLLFIHRTKKAVVEFRFCREYGIKKSEIVPFVASYTSSIDFEVESELNR